MEQDTKFEAKKSGVTVALSNAVVSAVQEAANTGETLSNAASNTGSSVMSECPRHVWRWISTPVFSKISLSGQFFDGVVALFCSALCLLFAQSLPLAQALPLPLATKLDRYGGTTDKSTFLAPADTPMAARALKDVPDSSTRDMYEVLKPLPVQQSNTMPWFDQPGMGLQYDTSLGPKGLTIQKLVRQGYLKKVSP